METDSSSSNPILFAAGGSAKSVSDPAGLEAFPGNRRRLFLYRFILIVKRDGMLEICPFSMIMEGIFYRKRCYERPWKNEETKNSPHMQGHTEWSSFPCLCQLIPDEISEEQDVSKNLKPNSDRRFAEVIRIIFGLNRMNLYSNMILYSWGKKGPILIVRTTSLQNIALKDEFQRVYDMLYAKTAL